MKSLARPDDKADVLRRLATVRADSPRRWGRMTAHQMVCHLGDAFLCVMGEKEASPASNVLTRTFLKWGALYVPLRWPAGFPTRPEMDQEIGGTRPSEFAADLERLQRVLHRIAASPRAFEWGRHPLFGRMSESDWMRWGYLHVDHHLRQFGA